MDTGLVQLESSVNRMAHLLTRNKRSEYMKLRARVGLDRAAMAVLRQIDESGAKRPGELAALLRVESPHITRQLQLLERKGYATRIADAGDRRAQLADLTDAGHAAAARLRTASREAMQEALTNWSAGDIRDLGRLLGRMVEDFEAHDARTDLENRSSTA